MARQFTSANSEYLTGPAGRSDLTLPLTLACWFYRDSTPSNDVLISTADASASAHWRNLGVNGNTVIMTSRAGIGEVAAIAAGTFGSTWHHACGITITDSNRWVYLDGSGTSGQNTESNAPSNIDRIGMGAEVGSSVDRYFNGRIAEAGVWDVQLTTVEIDMLAAGVSPRMVRPASLIWHAPMLPKTGNDFDVISGEVLTDNATVTSADHPRIIMPSAEIFRFPTPSGGGDTDPPVYTVAPAVDTLDSTSVIVDGTATDATGPIDHYFGVYADGSTPTAAEVKSGTGTGFVASTADSDLNVTSGVEASVTSGANLSPLTHYEAAMVAEDNLANLQASATLVGFVTDAALNEDAYTAGPYSPDSVLFGVEGIEAGDTWEIVAGSLSAGGLSVEDYSRGDYVLVPVSDFVGEVTFDYILLNNDDNPASQITSAVDNGSGLVRITSTAHGLVTDDGAYIENMVGVTSPNAKGWLITRIDDNTFDLQNSTFSGTYTSGGDWVEVAYSTHTHTVGSVQAVSTITVLATGTLYGKASIPSTATATLTVTPALTAVRTVKVSVPVALSVSATLSDVEGGWINESALPAPTWTPETPV